MKQKVLAWKNNGNELKDIQLDLEQKAPHVYFANRTIEHGEPYIDLVLDIGGVFIREENYAEDYLTPERIDIAQAHATAYLQKILTDEKLYPRLMEIEIVRRLGMTDYIETLQARRNRILAERKHKEEMDRQAREEAARIHAAREEERYLSDVQAFIKGESVTNERFAQILRRNDIPVHPRTMCNILDHCTHVRVGQISGASKRRSYDGVFQVAKALMEKLKSGE